jgi:hypothetical protein
MGPDESPINNIVLFEKRLLKPYQEILYNVDGVKNGFIFLDKREASWDELLTIMKGKGIRLQEYEKSFKMNMFGLGSFLLFGELDDYHSKILTHIDQILMPIQLIVNDYIELKSYIPPTLLLQALTEFCVAYETLFDEINSKFLLLQNNVSTSSKILPELISLPNFNERIAQTGLELSSAAKQRNSNPNCFIATAAYGSPFTAELGQFRAFRDDFISRNSIGVGFVKLYYRVGPFFSRVIENSERLRSIVRILLNEILYLIT